MVPGPHMAGFRHNLFTISIWGCRDRELLQEINMLSCLAHDAIYQRTAQTRTLMSLSRFEIFFSSL